MVNIISRAEWGFDGWAGNPYSVSPSERQFTTVHWEGGPTGYAIGADEIRAIHAAHKARGWAGIGYNFVVTDDGLIYEGRGWNRVGAHAPKFNRNGIGIQVHIGKGELPSDESLRSVSALHVENASRAGHAIEPNGHSDGFPTECPGPQLLKWAHEGMFAPAGVGTTPPPVVVIPPLVTPPAPPAQRSLVTQAYHGDVWMNRMVRGVNNSDSVRNLQRALRDYPGISTVPLNPSGVTGNYGSETVAMVDKVYRTFDQWQPGQGWASGDTGIPGRTLLTHLGLRVVG